MPRNRRRNQGFEMGVILLLMELTNVGFQNIPIVTLSTIVGQTLLYMGIFKPPWRKWDICISAESILKEHDYKRLFVSPVEHGDDLHLYYNMISFLVKGRSLETRYGSPNFALLLAILMTLTSFMYVGLGRLCMEVFQDQYYMKSCAIGFSGVIFALKVVTSKEEPQGMSNIGGVLLPVRHAAWAELVLIHILVPRASFMGHLAGILAGLLYTSTPLGTLLIIFSLQSQETPCFTLLTTSK